MTRPSISVIVCTRDRARLLARLLSDLREQEAPSGSFEVIVVDNGETGETRRLVDDLAAQDGSLRYVYEPEPGLSKARNRGYAVACADWVAYTDDDCRLPPGWLAVAAEIVERHDPDVFGGPYRACYDSPKPAWFKDEYGSRDLGAEARRLGSHEALSGGNIFIRRELLEELDGFDSDLGMVGSRVAYGEESDLQRRVRALRPQAKFYYDPRLWVHHLVRPQKMTLRWRLTSSFGKGRSSWAQGTVSVPAGRRWTLRWRMVYTAAAALADAAGALVVPSRRCDRHFRSHVYEQTSHYFRTLGVLWAAQRAADRSSR